MSVIWWIYRVTCSVSFSDFLAVVGHRSAALLCVDSHLKVSIRNFFSRPLPSPCSLVLIGIVLNGISFTKLKHPLWILFCDSQSIPLLVHLCQNYIDVYFLKSRDVFLYDVQMPYQCICTDSCCRKLVHSFFWTEILFQCEMIKRN